MDLLGHVMSRFHSLRTSHTFGTFANFRSLHLTTLEVLILRETVYIRSIIFLLQNMIKWWHQTQF